MKNNQFPLVSIIMNCHNSDKYLYESIKSVLSQTYEKWKSFFGTINRLIIAKSY